VATRLAVREASRHRTAPATSAIAVAVAGSVLLAYIVAANNHATLVNYQVGLPKHTIHVPTEESTISVAGGVSATKRERTSGHSSPKAAYAVAAQLRGGRVYRLRQPADDQPPVPRQGGPAGSVMKTDAGDLWVTPDCRRRECTTAAGNRPEKPTTTPLLIAILAAAFITLAGAAISIALSAAEGRADLATLAAVGAAPSRRRALAASQALVVAGVGCGLVVALGTFVAYTVRSTSGVPGFVVPWTNLLLTAIAVPALAMAVAAVFTPSRLPLVRRAA
jgi:hypothetical protein